MYFSGTQGSGITFQTSATVPTGGAEGASYEPTGTVTQTETNGVDAGYSLEVVVHTADFGYQAGDTVMLSACVWDLDYSSTDAYNEHISDYAPNWWGSQWADPSFEKYFMYRGVILSTSEAIDNEKVAVADRFELYPNYPNPFNPSTTISFSTPASGQVRLDIYNILGQKIRTLVNNELPSGYHHYEWNGLTETGLSAPTGLYLYKVSYGNNFKVAKMVLSK